jgi:hypothetical protein
MKRALRNLDYVLKLGGNNSAPLFLAWLDNSIVGFEVLWGQHGGYLRYPIKNGLIVNLAEYLVATNLATDLDIEVNLTITEPLGMRQRIASATGGIITYQKDGRANGVGVGEARTNIHTNPILGHLTYNNGWTAEASLIIAPIIDKPFVRFGARSVKITSVGASTNTFTQTLTLAATTHTAIYYVKLPDGSAVTTTEVEISYNGTDQTTTFVVDPERSDGWYIATAEFTGTGTATTLGVKVNSGFTAYFGMFQCAAVDYSHYPVHGEQMGSAWTGTAHASTSTRTVGRIRQPVGDIFDRGQGTIVIAFRAEDGNSPERLIRDLFEIDTLDVRLRYANPLWTFTDGTNTATSAGENGSSAYNEGDIIVVHCTYDPDDGIAQYFNGIVMGTNATFTPGSTGTYMYIGSNSSVANHMGDEILLFETYNQPMDSATVLAHYTNLASALADSDKIGDIPWLWTKDGDDVVDNAMDTAKHNFCVIGGVPGSTEAEFEIRADLGGSDFSAEDAVWLSRLDMENEDFFLPTILGDGPLFASGAGVGDSGSSFDVYGNVTVGTTAVIVGQNLYLARKHLNTLTGKKLQFFLRMQDAAANLQIQPRILFSGSSILGKFKNVAPGATFEVVKSSPLDFPRLDSIGPLDVDPSTILFEQIEFTIYAKRSAGSDTVGWDYLMVFPEPTLKIFVDTTSSSENSFLYDSSTHSGFTSTGSADSPDLATFLVLTGGKFTLVPDRLNMIFSLIGDIGIAPDITFTMTYTETYVTPKWSLI